MKNIIVGMLLIIVVLSICLFVATQDIKSLIVRRNEITTWYDDELDKARMRQIDLSREIKSLKNKMNVLERAIEQR